MNLKKLAKIQQRFGLLKASLTLLASKITKKPYTQRKTALGLAS